MTFEDTIWLTHGISRSPLEFPDDFADGEEVAEYKLVRKGVVRRRVSVEIAPMVEVPESAQ